MRKPKLKELQNLPKDKYLDSKPGFSYSKTTTFDHSPSLTKQRISDNNYYD